MKQNPIDLPKFLCQLRYGTPSPSQDAMPVLSLKAIARLLALSATTISNYLSQIKAFPGQPLRTKRGRPKKIT
jgi:transposase